MSNSGQVMSTNDLVLQLRVFGSTLLLRGFVIPLARPHKFSDRKPLS
jgi:hypothetical protein